MTQYVLPNEWIVGIKAIDQEHQELFDMLFITQHEEAGEAQKSTKYFDSFFNRLSVLMENRENHMEEHNYHSLSLQLKKESHNKMLKRLQGLKESKSSMLHDACMSTLLREIADAELYYNNSKIKL